MPKLNNNAQENRSSIPETASRMGAATVLHPEDVFADPSIGPGLVLPDMPDFEAIAEEQCQAIAAYSAFHETAIGFFAPRLDEEAHRYCLELQRVYEEYSSHLTTTYRAALVDELEQVKSRLASMPYAHDASNGDVKPNRKEKRQ